MSLPSEADARQPQDPTAASSESPAAGQASSEPSAAEAEASFDASVLPAIVARVNGREISREALLEEVQAAARQLTAATRRRPLLDERFHRQALEQIIAGIVIMEDARAQGVAATDEEIDQRIREASARFASDEEFQQGLAEQGLTVETLREDLDLEISRQKYIAATIAPGVTLSDDEMRLFYDQNLERMRQPERIKVRHILISVPSDASEEERAAARQRAEQLRDRARSGEDFAVLAYESSDDDSKSEGGELPWIARGQTVPAFEAAAFSLEAGEVSDVVDTPFGFHIIKGIDRQPSRIASFDEVEERIDSVLRNEKLQRALLARVGELEAAAQIERFFPAD